MEVLVTVGMGPWPFDRLVAAAGALAAEHRVFAQTGPSSITPNCQHARFLEPAALMAAMRSADVVVCHAGNTVRLVQRLGKVPIVLAREARRGEMGNDHQVAFLRREEGAGRVIAVWDVGDLREAVGCHPEVERELLAKGTIAPPATAHEIAASLDSAWRRTGGNPFGNHPMRRYAYAWRQLSGRHGTHLDLGCGEGELMLALADRTGLRCEGADPHGGRVNALRAARPDLRFTQIRPGHRLPYADETFDSVSLLDVLEHAADHRKLLAESHRVLKSGGLLVLTVPAQHVFSFLDPDQAKLRFPRLHRFLYSMRFGRGTYSQRFGDRGDGLFGDMSRGAPRHHNFAAEELLGLLTQVGFRVTDRSGANLFWRVFHLPALIATGRLRNGLDRLIRIDGEAFRSANLFLCAERRR